MIRYGNNVQDQFGNALPSATVYVYKAGTGVLATIYADEEGVVTFANPLSTDSNGEFYFYALAASYDIRVEKLGYPTIEIPDVVLSNTNKDVFIIACSDETTTLTAGTAKVTWRMPFGYSTIDKVKASLTTASSSGPVTVDVNCNGVSIFSTVLTIDEGEKTTFTSTTPAVISATLFNEDDEITVDIDAAGTGATGLKVYIIGTKM